MYIFLRNNDYRYAAEQMLLTLYPEQRPEYPEGSPEGERIELRLSRGEKLTTASCKLVIDGKGYHGRAAISNNKLEGELLTDRYCQRLIKNAMYCAALSSGHQRPAWGALTGVRPGKIFCSLLSSGLSEEEAEQRFIEEYDVTPERAVRHPNWSMGAKISVDSATMMNKGLEFVEAMHLFSVTPDDIQVVVHPQKIGRAHV